MRENRQRERGSLPCPRLGDADQVMTCNDLRYGSRLDWCRLSVTRFLDGLENAGVEAQGAKRHGRWSMGAIAKNARQFAHHVRPAKTCAMVVGMSSRIRTTIVFLMVAASLSCCRTTKFYTQAIRGQWEVLARARPIAEVRDAPDTPAELRKKLELVGRLRTFAHEELKLPTNREFRNYADLGRKYVVWNVIAAPEFSLEAKTWSYPLLGDLKYRGFFSEAAAREEGARVKALGYD